MSHKIPSPGGKERWQTSVIKSILQNEKYAGNALLQKRFTVDFLTKARKKNEGEVPQFWVEDSHPAIIAVDEWDAVQAEMARCDALGRPMDCHSSFATRIVYGDCGGYYGSKVWGSNTKYRRTVWNGMADNRNELITDCRAAKNILCDCNNINDEIKELERDVEVTTELSRKAILIFVIGNV